MFFGLLRRKKPVLPAFVIRPSARMAAPSPGLRRYAPTDLDACVRLYRDNEGGRFPAGYLDTYIAHLESGKSLTLVLERDGELIGTGGIQSSSQPGSRFYYTLTFGLVASRLQGQGLGTTLLLARIALLLDNSSPWPVILQAVSRSRTFYEQFGFRWIYAHPSESLPIEGYFLAHVAREAVHAARTQLRSRGIDIQGKGWEIPYQPYVPAEEDSEQ